MYHKLGEVNDKWVNGFDPNIHEAMLFQDIQVTS